MGRFADGTPYDANDPRLLAFVHLAGSAMFLAGYRRFANPAMPQAERDAYWDEVAIIAEKLGADPVPRSEAEAEALARSFLHELRPDERSRAVRDIILNSPPERLRLFPVQRLLMRSAVDLLPREVRRLHGLRGSGLATPAVAPPPTALLRPCAGPSLRAKEGMTMLERLLGDRILRRHI